MSDKKPSKNRPEVQRPRVLSGHRRQGKRFIPPFLQYMNLTETRWLDDLVPELIWIALIIDRFERQRGAEICVGLAKAAAACSTKATGAYAFISEYSRLKSREQQCVIDKLADAEILNELGDALQVLKIYYPESPFAFILSNQESWPVGEDGLNRLKLLIEELSDRRGVTATFVQATAVYVYFLNDKLKVSAGSALADFTAIEAYPSTDASVKVASFIRALLNGFPASLDLSSDWRNYFWNNGRRIESCEGIENGGEK